MHLALQQLREAALRHSSDHAAHFTLILHCVPQRVHTVRPAFVLWHVHLRISLERTRRELREKLHPELIFSGRSSEFGKKKINELRRELVRHRINNFIHCAPSIRVSLRGTNPQRVQIAFLEHLEIRHEVEDRRSTLQDLVVRMQEGLDNRVPC